MRSLTTPKLVFLIIIALLGMGSVGCFTVFDCFTIGGGGPGGITADLELWGVFDEPSDLEGFLPERTGPSTLFAGDVRYRRIEFEDFEREVLDAVAAGRGPDIIYIHHTWLPKFKDKLAPAPLSLTTEAQFREYYVDVAHQDFSSYENGIWNLWAIPLYTDTLGLFWNRDLFNAKGISKAPETWDDFANTVRELVEYNPDGSAKIAGAAMGTARNVNRAPDIVSMLMLQNGTRMVSDDKLQATFARVAQGREREAFSPGEDALRFYTDFADPTKDVYTWDRAPLMPDSIDAFISGKVAMMFNYSHMVKQVRERAPHLNFSVAPVPQPVELLEQGKAVTYPNYFGLAVLRSSENTEAAWALLADLTFPEKIRTYLNNTGRPPATRDLIPEFSIDPDFAVFARQALTAASWYQPDHEAIENIFNDMIESVKDGVAAREAIRRAEENVTLLLQKLQRSP